jgi:hypothetical protein
VLKERPQILRGGMPKGTNKVIKILVWVAGIWAGSGWAWGVYDTILFDLGQGGSGQFAGANAITVLLVALFTFWLAVSRSPRKLLAVSRILGWTLLQCVLATALVFTLVRAYDPMGNPATVGGDCTGTTFLLGLLAYSIWQLRINRKDAGICQSHEVGGSSTANPS